LQNRRKGIEDAFCDVRPYDVLLLVRFEERERLSKKDLPNAKVDNQ
jgi:hypothetical protein